MPYLPTAFHRLVEPLDRRLVDQAVARHRGNHGVGSGAGAWTCQRHLKTLLFAQFAGLRSLREIEQASAARPGALYHLGLRPAKRTTLSDALAARPAAVFRDLADEIIARLSGRARQQGQAVIRLLDASPINLRDQRFDWAEADARCRGLKLHLVYDPRAGHPLRFAVTSPKVSDLAQGRAIAIAPGATYVFDKGYTDYAWWQAIAAAGAVFVTRLKRNVCRRQVRPNPTTDPTILADAKLRLGYKQPRGGADNPLYDTELREIVVARDGRNPLHLVTNDHHRTAADIAALYKERWQIELFFKWIKQNLKIKPFLGRSENAVKIQIYVCLIAFCLLRLFQHSHASSYKGAASALLARLKVALFDPLDLSGRAIAQPRPPQLRKPSPQLALLLAAGR